MAVGVGVCVGGKGNPALVTSTSCYRDSEAGIVKSMQGTKRCYAFQSPLAIYKRTGGRFHMLTTNQSPWEGRPLPLRGAFVIRLRLFSCVDKRQRRKQAGHEGAGGRMLCLRSQNWYKSTQMLPLSPDHQTDFEPLLSANEVTFVFLPQSSAPGLMRHVSVKLAGLSTISAVNTAERLPRRVCYH